LTYRGYDVHVLAEQASFEEVAFLVLNGELPNRDQLANFCAAIAEGRCVPAAVYDALRSFPKEAHPMDILRAGVSLLALHDPDRTDHSAEANMRKAIRLIGQIGALVPNGYRIVVQGEPPVQPDSSISHAGNILYMLTGQRPDPLAEHVINGSLILYMEHGLNASTFASRVVVSTLSDLYSGTIAAIGALKGPLHGGANEAAMELLLDVGTPDRAREYIREALAAKKKVMGFGHREYKHSDSRAGVMKEFGKRVCEQKGDWKWFEIAEAIEQEMWEAKKLFPNLDFPSAWTYYLLGLPIPLYTPLFAASRTVGWSAHMIEQLSANRIIRPTSLYNGPAPREFVPLSDR
jgi:citrate synthase